MDSATPLVTSASFYKNVATVAESEGTHTHNRFKISVNQIIWTIKKVGWVNDKNTVQTYYPTLLEKM
jgi:hypothetical protein